MDSSVTVVFSTLVFDLALLTNDSMKNPQEKLVVWVN